MQPSAFTDRKETFLPPRAPAIQLREMDIHIPLGSSNMRTSLLLSKGSLLMRRSVKRALAAAGATMAIATGSVVVGSSAHAADYSVYYAESAPGG